MTVPEESRPKTETTDQVVEEAAPPEEQPKTHSGATLREAFEEADVSPEDFEENPSGG
ncbi:hypothetical protein MMF93_01640 [Streptomyces tubbatahanensis]|uniref:Uncharacterized protein n=1 Tax=Streptomyces tubbatahanensis TaxID=2923272 RepID=A0ABY3XLH5_9ACTN|nr:hypothetical protein [Streptomyces tubbatahanensis]UNS95312.1 hypothetical protein MMF93_01640 [Streptomyces tubbatahanensis]